MKTARVLNGLEWLLLISALGLFTTTEVYDTRVTAGLGLLAVFFVLRSLRGRLWTRQTGLEIPTLLFVGSAGMATFISFDSGNALLQFARILAGIGLFTMLLESGRKVQYALVAAFFVAAVALAIYWPLQHDFQAQPAKFGPINTAGLWIESHLPEVKFENLTGPSIHPNVASGTLALAAPFGAALAWELARKRRWLLSLLAGLGTLAIIATVVLTSARGAWLNLAAAMGLLILAVIQRRWFATRRQKWVYWSGLALLAVIGLGTLAFSGRLVSLLGQVPDPTGSLRTRPEVWRQGWSLAQDYVYTGSGLASFWMVHAVYALLIHVPYLAHTHTTLLEIWIEQGILGVLAAIWGGLVVLTWAWRALDRKSLPVWGAAALLALAGMAVQSSIDVLFYIERTLPLVGLALGYAWQAVRDEELDPEPVSARQRRGMSRLASYALAAGLAALLALALIFHRPLIAAWYANLGALEQARREMAVYDADHFDNPTLDQVRRQIDLSMPETYYHKALGWQPDNRTALLRLSQIALSRGEYERAWGWAQIAWQAGYRDEVTRLTFGDAAVANGEPQLAAPAVAGLTWAEGRLLLQAFYRYQSDQDIRRAADACRAVLLINPNNTQAANMLSEYEKKLVP
ncbi:MAG: O-antigen ligase family protein [Chloroflexota bacterium]